MKTNELLRKIEVEKMDGICPSEVFSIETNSKEIQKDSMFVCIQGEQYDGHDFIEEAIQKGSTVIIVEKEIDIQYEQVCVVKVKSTVHALGMLANVFYQFPSQKMKVIGITGTNGKTTCANIIYKSLKKVHKRVGIMGTMGIEFCDQKRDSSNTTNDALTIQRTLHEMYEQGVTHVVMEVSSHGLVQKRTMGITFDIGMFTNLTQEHLDFHGTMESYGYAKGLLFSQMGQNLQEEHYAVLNSDEEWTKRYQEITNANIVTYGLKNDCDFKACNIRYQSDYTTFDVFVKGKQSMHIETPFIGEFNVYNLLGSMVILHKLGISLLDIQKIMQDIVPPKGRLEKVEVNVPLHIFVDYAHTPDGVEKVLRSFTKEEKRKIIVLISASGDRDKGIRSVMAEKASEHADFVILTTDHPRFEPEMNIVNDMEKGMKMNRYVKIPDRKQAIQKAIEIANEQDIIIVTGKGHENYVLKEGKKIHFDEKEIIKQAIYEKIIGYKYLNTDKTIQTTKDNY